MIQKCPNCGAWCETEGSGMLQRFGEGWNKSVENAAEIVGGDSFIGNVIGGAIGGNTGIIRGGLKALFGDRYEFHCPACGYEWGTDDEEDDETEEFLREQRNNGDDTTEQIDEQLAKFESAEQYKDAVSWLESLLSNSDYDGYYGHILRKIAIINYAFLDDNDAALKASERGIELLKNEPWSFDDSFLRFVKYNAEAELGHIWMARAIALMVSQNATTETIGDDLLKDVAWNDFNEFDKQYSDLFLQMEYKDRKAILVTSEYTDTTQDHIDIFTKQRLPQQLLDAFPVGHPINNQVYIGHPYLPEVYLPLETYQYYFVEDRVREFCEIAQALGATEITVEALNSSNTNHNGSRDRRASGGASYSGHSASGSYHGNDAYGSVEEKYQTLNFHQEYDPSEPVHLPDKMVWYPHESGWQRLYQQRLKGILRHEERIETRKSQVLSASELKEIKGEVETIFEANGEWDESMEEMFVQEDNAILSIKVKFAPLSQLTGNPQKSVSKQEEKALSSEEQDYLEMYKEYNVRGTISDLDRKMLDKFRGRCGISDERARELEASCSIPQLTEDEQEYYELYKEYVADGELSERDRKMLNKMRERMGISEERAKEIEYLV